MFARSPHYDSSFKTSAHCLHPVPRKPEITPTVSA